MFRSALHNVCCNLIFIIILLKVFIVSQQDNYMQECMWLQIIMKFTENNFAKKSVYIH